MVFYVYLIFFLFFSLVFMGGGGESDGWLLGQISRLLYEKSRYFTALKSGDFQFLPSRQVSCMVCFSSQGNKAFLVSRNLYNKPFILEKSRHYCQHSLYGPVLQSVFCLCSCIILSGSSGNVIAARELKEKALWVKSNTQWSWLEASYWPQSAALGKTTCPSLQCLYFIKRGLA